MSRESTTMQVRVAVQSDAAQIAMIYNGHVDLGGSTFDTQHWTCDDVVQMLGLGEPDGWFVAEENGVTVGWTSARRHSLRYGYRFTCETAIYLPPTAFGRGIADALQQRIERHCRAQGMHHAVAKIIADNQRSIAFHQRYGYEIVGVQREIGHMNGKWCDVAILQKILSDRQDDGSDHTPNS